MQRHGECLLIGIRYGVVLRRGFHIKRDGGGFVGGSVLGVVEAGVEGVGVAEFTADVHGEFEFPTHGFDDVSRGDFAALGVGEGDFDVGAFLEGGDLDIDAQAVSVGVGGGGKGGDAGLCGYGAGEVVFGEEKFHVQNYTYKHRGISVREGEKKITVSLVVIGIMLLWNI